MENILFNMFLRIRKINFFRIVMRTLIMVAPIALIGVVFQVLHNSLFATNSLFYNLLNLDLWIPRVALSAASYVTTGMMQATFGMFGLYVAYFAALYTARIYHKDSKFAGANAVMILLFMSYRYTSGSSRFAINFNILNSDNILLALLIGYGVGQIYHWLGSRYHHQGQEHIRDLRQRAYNTFLPLIVSIPIGIVLGSIVVYIQTRIVDTNGFQQIVQKIMDTSNIAISIPLTMFNMLLIWMGIGFPTVVTNVNNSANATTNMNYALIHGSAWGVPYKYLGVSLEQAYGTMNGGVFALALVIVLLLFSHRKEVLRMAKVNLLPSIFNAGQAIWVGVPILLNPIYLVPFTVIPGLNMLLAAGAIALNLIPAAVYPLLSGTPGMLISFVATNGNWNAFIFSMLLLVVDIGILIPFVKLSYKVERTLKEEGALNDQF